MRGGPDAYEDSLKTGNYVLSLLHAMPDEYEASDIFVSKTGDWHCAGLVEDAHKILDRTDVVWNALHGQYGESGEVQKLFEGLQVPHTGSGAAASAFAHNKEMAKTLYRTHGLLTPASTALHRDDVTDEALISMFRSYLHPVIVKPATGVRGVGVAIAYSFQELKDALARCFCYSPKVLVEEYVAGTVVSTTVLERAKGEDLYALLPTHIETEYRRVRPRPEQNREVERAAREAHRALGLRHYSSTDCIITPRGKVYVLETNSNPVFHADSLLQRSLEASGWQPQEFVQHSLNLARGLI